MTAATTSTITSTTTTRTRRQVAASATSEHRRQGKTRRWPQVIVYEWPSDEQDLSKPIAFGVGRLSDSSKSSQRASSEPLTAAAGIGSSHGAVRHAQPLRAPPMACALVAMGGAIRWRPPATARQNDEPVACGADLAHRSIAAVAAHTHTHTHTLSRIADPDSERPRSGLGETDGQTEGEAVDFYGGFLRSVSCNKLVAFGPKLLASDRHGQFSVQKWAL